MFSGLKPTTASTSGPNQNYTVSRVPAVAVETDIMSPCKSCDVTKQVNSGLPWCIMGRTEQKANGASLRETAGNDTSRDLRRLAAV